MNRKKLLKFSLASVLTLSATAYFTDGSQASEMEIDKETEENHEVQVNENSNGWGDESGIVIDEELSEEEDSVVPYPENEAPNTFNTDGYANATDDWEDGNQEVEDGDLEEEDFEVDYGDWDPNAAYDEFGNLLYTAEEVNHYENVLNNALQTPNSYVYVADGVYEYYYDVNEEGYAINEREGERVIPADLIHRKYEIFSNEKLYQLGVDIPPSAPEGPEVEDPGDDEVVEPEPEPEDPDVEEGGDEPEPEPEPEPEEPVEPEPEEPVEPEPEEPVEPEPEPEPEPEEPVEGDDDEEDSEDEEETDEPVEDEDSEDEEETDEPVEEDDSEDTNQEDPVIEDDLSPNYLNEITLIDSESGNEIRNLSFVGSTFDNRLSNLLKSINENYGTEYIVENQTFVGRTINSSTINGVTQTRTTNSYEIYLSNDSDIKYPFDEQVFIPDHPLYDDVHADNTLKDITITDTDGVIVYIGSTQAEVTVDEFIRQSMGNIDSDIYFYESVSVTSGVTTRITNEGFYSGEFQDINVIVDFVAMEDEESPSEGDEDEAETPPSEGEGDDAEEPPAEDDGDDAEEPPAEDDGDDAEEPPSEGEGDDSEEPPSEGEGDDAEEPPAEDDGDDAEEPPSEGEGDDSEEPPSEGDVDNSEEPPAEGDADDSEEPPSEGDTDDSEEPPSEGDVNDSEEPPAEGDADDSEEPPAEGDEDEAETPSLEVAENDAEERPTEVDEDNNDELPAEDGDENEPTGESSGDDETSEPTESEGNVIEQGDIDKNKTYTNASIEPSVDDKIASVKTDSTEEGFVKSSNEITENDDNEVTSDTLPDTGIAEQRTTLLATILAALGLGFLVRKRKQTEK